MNDPVPATGFDFNRPTVVSLLYLASFLIGVGWLIAGVLAFVWNGEPHASWEDSHFRFHIRTFWLGIALCVAAFVATVLTLGLGGFLVFPLLALWFLVRCIKALLAAQRHEALANPDSWLW